MLLNSTTWSFGSRALAAFAATCLVSGANVHAESGTARRAVGDHLRPAMGTTGRGSEFDGQIIYLDIDVEAPRQTTDREHLIASMAAWQKLSDNWDDEGAKAPVQRSLKAASDFVCALPENMEVAEAMIHPDTGHAGISWSLQDYYGELEFLADGRAAYYFDRGRSKAKGVVELIAGSIPPEIEPLLPA